MNEAEILAILWDRDKSPEERDCLIREVLRGEHDADRETIVQALEPGRGAKAHRFAKKMDAYGLPRWARPYRVFLQEVHAESFRILQKRLREFQHERLDDPSLKCITFVLNRIWWDLHNWWDKLCKESKQESKSIFLDLGKEEEWGQPKDSIEAIEHLIRPWWDEGHIHYKSMPPKGNGITKHREPPRPAFGGPPEPEPLPESSREAQALIRQKFIQNIPGLSKAERFNLDAFLGQPIVDTLRFLHKHGEISTPLFDVLQLEAMRPPGQGQKDRARKLNISVSAYRKRLFDGRRYLASLRVEHEDILRRLPTSLEKREQQRLKDIEIEAIQDRLQEAWPGAKPKDVLSIITKSNRKPRFAKGELRKWNRGLAELLDGHASLSEPTPFSRSFKLCRQAYTESRLLGLLELVRALAFDTLISPRHQFDFTEAYREMRRLPRHASMKESATFGYGFPVVEAGLTIDQLNEQMKPLHDLFRRMFKKSQIFKSYRNYWHYVLMCSSPFIAGEGKCPVLCTQAIYEPIHPRSPYLWEKWYSKSNEAWAICPHRQWATGREVGRIGVDYARLTNMLKRV